LLGIVSLTYTQKAKLEASEDIVSLTYTQKAKLEASEDIVSLTYTPLIQGPHPDVWSSLQRWSKEIYVVCNPLAETSICYLNDRSQAYGNAHKATIQTVHYLPACRTDRCFGLQPMW
jgi:hypothetical protein